MKLRTFTITAVAVLAIAAPAAQGAVLASDQGSSQSSAISTVSAQTLNALDQRWQALAQYYAHRQIVRPDDRGGIRGTGQRPQPVVAATASHPSNFSWVEAGLAAGAAAVLLALVGSRRIAGVRKPSSQSLRTG